MSTPSRPIWTRRVREAHAVRGPARAVLWAIADHADEHGETWVSQGTLVDESGFEESAVRTAVHWLQASGYLLVTPRIGTSPLLALMLGEDGGPMMPGCALPETWGKRTPSRDEGGSRRKGGARGTPPGSATHRGEVCHAPGGGVRGAPEGPMKDPLKIPVRDPEETRALDTTPEADAIDRLAEAWQQLVPDGPMVDRSPLFGMLRHAGGEDMPLAVREAEVLRVLRFIAYAPKGRGLNNTAAWLRDQGASTLRFALDLKNRCERFRSLLSWSKRWEADGCPVDADVAVEVRRRQAAERSARLGDAAELVNWLGSIGENLLLLELPSDSEVAQFMPDEHRERWMPAFLSAGGLAALCAWVDRADPGFTDRLADAMRRDGDGSAEVAHG